jgi:hypothetical protein
VLYAVVRVSAFKIRKLAEAEKEAHIQKGWWKEPPDTCPVCKAKAKAFFKVG